MNILNEFEQGITHTFLWDSPRPGFWLCVIFGSPPEEEAIFSMPTIRAAKGQGAPAGSQMVSLARISRAPGVPWLPWLPWSSSHGISLRITGMTMPLLGLVDLTLGGSSRRWRVSNDHSRRLHLASTALTKAFRRASC